MLLTRPLSASDVGTWRAAGRRDERAPGELIVAQLPRQVQFEAPPPSAAMTRPGLALLAARQRHVRFGSRPSTAAAIDRLVDRYAAANAVTRYSKKRPPPSQPSTTTTTTTSAVPPAPQRRPPPPPPEQQQMRASRFSAHALRLAKNIYEACVLGRRPLSDQHDEIARLLTTLPLLQGVPAHAIGLLAKAATLRIGERYHKLYNVGTEVDALAEGGGHAFLILAGSAEASEQLVGRAREEPPHSRADRYGPADICGCEVLIAPTQQHSSDPLVPRGQTCAWTTNGAALALPLASLVALPLQPARRQLRLNLCAQLLAPLLATTWSGSMRAPLSGLLQQLATDATLTRRPAGELLYTSGCKSDELLFLIRGAVDVYVPPQEQNEPPSISGGRQTRSMPTLMRSSGSVADFADEAGHTERRYQPGILDASPLSDVSHEQSARVAPYETHGEASAIILSLPARHARLVLSKQPALRAAFFHNANLYRPVISQDDDPTHNPLLTKEYTIATPQHRQVPVLHRPRSAPGIGGPPSDDDGARPSTAPAPSPPEPKFLPHWTRARADQQSRIALLQITSGARRSADPPWSFLISQMDLKLPPGQGGGEASPRKMAGSASTPALLGGSPRR